MNSTKTQALSVGPCAYRYSLLLNNARIEFLRSIKILGVTLDKDLSYKEHISDQLKKAYAKASALTKYRNYSNYCNYTKLHQQQELYQLHPTIPTTTTTKTTENCSNYLDRNYLDMNSSIFVTVIKDHRLFNVSVLLQLYRSTPGGLEPTSRQDTLNLV